MLNTQHKPWQAALKQAFTDPVELLNFLKLNHHPQFDETQSATQTFPFRVPRHFAECMTPGDPNDPLLLQVLPQKQELLPQVGYTTNPLSESNYNPVPGVLHKYKHRVLLTVTGHCAVQCRYCFRRTFAYSENNPGRPGWKAMIQYIQSDPSITEVILSGGDPLSAPDRILSDLHQQLSAIPHLQRFRIHTRFPVVIPERINSEFLSWFGASPFQTIFVTHINHPQEISPALTHALSRLRNQAPHVTLLNQTVLLRHINNHVDTLVQLSERLFHTGIMPYYLHLLDPIEGAAHFDVLLEEATQIMQSMLARLPGYLVPKLVREEPHKPNKTWIL